MIVGICLKMEDSLGTNLTGKENSYNPRRDPKKNRLFPNPSSSSQRFFDAEPPNIGKEEQTISSLKVEKNGASQGKPGPKLPNSVTQRMTKFGS